MAGITVNQEQCKWRWFFGLAALEAGAAFVALWVLPRGGQMISPVRALLLGVLALSFVGALTLGFRAPRWLAALRQPSIIVATAFCSVLIAIALFLLRFLDPTSLLPYYQRLGPLLWYLLLLGVQASVLLLILKYGVHSEGILGRGATLRPAGVALLGLALVLGFIATTRIGLTPDSAYWGEPGVPILGWQLALALVAGFSILVAGLRFRLESRIDFFIGVGLWLLAAFIWLSIPASMTRNSFYAPITPPTNQPFPNSDAGYYDSMAESLLIGHPYQGEIPTRPLYILALTLLHLAVGEDYGLIVAGQTLLLALIPVLLYLLGKVLHSRAAGLMAALIAIFREWTTIWVSSQTRVSDSRTLLVDLPTLLLVLLACLFAVRWLARREWRNAMLAGGVFGLLLLLRTQSVLIAPALVVVVLAALGFRNKRWIAPITLFVVVLVVTATPWLLHNFVQTRQLSLDAPFQYQIITSQYRYTGNLDINSIDLRGKSVVGILLTFLIHDPGFVLGFIATHFLATEIDGLLVLPLFHAYAGLDAPMNLYWINWESQLGALNVTLLGVYLVVLAVGLGAAWRRLRWAGLIPLVFSLGYALANGIGRFSGWRYDLPADWISYFYFSLGVAEALATGALVFGATADRVFERDAHIAPGVINRGPAIMILLGFALIGSLPWLAQGLASPRYADQSQERLVRALGASAAVADLGVSTVELNSFVASPSAVIQVGRLLYPRFFPRNLGLASAHPWPAYSPRDFPRMGFLLLNQTRSDVVFPTRQLGGTFPQGMDVIVLGCRRLDYLEARLVYFPASNSAYSSGPLNQLCQ